MKKAPNTVYIGYDPKERVAYEVLKFTIERISVDNIRVVPYYTRHLTSNEYVLERT
jgi:hypothetical protein